MDVFVTKADGTKQLFDARATTYLRRLNRVSRRRLLSNGIILLKQLTEMNPSELRKQTGIPKKDIELIIRRSRAILSGK